MIDFESVLANLECRAAERAGHGPRMAQSRARLCATQAHAVLCAPDPWDGYAAHATPARPAQSETAADPADLRNAIAAAAGDARQLHALRRHIARVLHPDRGGDGALLAECNALIDAALRTSRRRT